MNNAFREVPLTSRIGGFGNDQPSFGAASVPVLPVVAVDGATNSPLGVHRNSTARQSLPWEQEPSLRERLRAAITQDDQSGAPLLFELDALEKKIHAYLRSKQQEQTLDLKAELAQIGAKGRAAVERARQTDEALNVARGTHSAWQEEVGKRQKALAAVRAARPSDDDFPSDEEVDAYQLQLATAQTRHDAAAAHSKRLWQAMQQAKAEARQAEQALAAIKARRNELEALLEGGNKRPSAIAGLGPIGLQG
jgi:chromosome segregation ATPase